jgi:hypothetical protein
LHPLLVVHQEQALADGVQDGVVVLDHARQLRRRQAVGLPAQPPAQRPAAECPDAEGHQRRPGDAGDGAGEVPADRLDGDAGRHQRDDVTAGVQHRAGRPHRRAEGAGVGLGEGAPGQRRLDRAAEGPADLRGVGMGVSGAVGREDGDERRPRVGADLFDVGLEHRRRIGPGDRREHQRRVREALDDRGGLLLGRLPDGLARVEVGDDRRGQDDDGDHQRLQQQQPARQARVAAPPVREERGHVHARECPAHRGAHRLPCTQ